MSNLLLGDRVFLTARGSTHHPPVGSDGTVIGVATHSTFVEDSRAVTVRWDDGTETVVTRWNGRLAPAGA